MTTTYEVAALPASAAPQTAVQQTTAPATVSSAVQLHQGPVWPSWEQFRLAGSRGLDTQIPLGTVGRLITKHGEFACLRWRDFDRIYGLAQDVQRLSQGVMLLHQAAEVVMRSEQLDLGIKMIRDLTLQYQLPAVAKTPLPPLDVETEEDDAGDDERSLDEFAPTRPQWG